MDHDGANDQDQGDNYKGRDARVLLLDYVKLVAMTLSIHLMSRVCIQPGNNSDNGLRASAFPKPSSLKTDLPIRLFPLIN